jgi:hypothetical protein
MSQNQNIVKSALLAVLCFLFLNTCTVFKKEIVKPVVVAMPDTNFTANVISTANFNKYSPLFTGGQLARAFMAGFKREAAITKNVTLKFDASGADFILKVKTLQVKETTTTQVINDPKSPYNGQQVELNVVEASAALEITSVAKPAKKMADCTNSKMRSERETNNRSLDEIISGANKDKTQYHTKLLQDNICLTLSDDVGRRIWVPVTRRIAKAIK